MAEVSIITDGADTEFAVGETGKEAAAAPPPTGDEGIVVTPPSTDFPEHMRKDAAFEKFTNVEAMGASYREMESKLTKEMQRDKISVAPEAYADETIPEGLEIPEANIQAFKDMNMSDEQVKGSLGMLKEYVSAIGEKAVEIERNSLMQHWGLKVGDTADEARFAERAAPILRWAADRYGGDDVAKQLSSTAQSVMVMEHEMRMDAKSQQVTEGNRSTGSEPVMTREQIEQWMADQPDYFTNPVKKRQVAVMYERLAESQA